LASNQEVFKVLEKHPSKIFFYCIDDTNENKKLGIFHLFDLNWGGDGDT
jgi:hypothetical protein